MSEKFFENSIEKGKSVIIKAVFTRHGEKEYDPNNAETGLTEQGKKESFVSGQQKTEVDVVKPYSSRTLRTKETAQLEAKGSPTKNKGEYRSRDELNFPYDHKGEFFLQMNKIKKDIIGSDYDKLDKVEFKKRLVKATSAQTDYYLNFKDKKPDIIAPAPIEAAANIAKMVNDYSHMTEHLNSGSTVDLINATHDLNLSAFLKEDLVRDVNNKKVLGFDSINDIGGSIGFNEQFEILIKTDMAGEKNIKLLFRGQEYGIDEERLNELVTLNIENKNEDK